MITVAVDTKQIDELLAKVMARTRNAMPAMRVIGEIVRSSIRENFRAGGRPARWKRSARAKEQSGQTLRDRNILYNSFTVKATGSKVEVGTNVKYAAAHHFGVSKTVSQRVREHVRRVSQAFGKPVEPRKVTVAAHNRTMKMRLPARPFMLVQDEDWDDIRDVLGKFIIEGK